MTSMTPPMANGTLDSSETNGKNFWSHKVILERKYQKFLDEVTPYVALGIYLLNLFLAFLQPKFDPSLEMDIAESEVEEGPSLPTKADEEFRPFIRRLPEFKFWHSSTKAVIISLICTFFSMFDIPVFWPILLIYFCILFAITMKRQIKHMIKYKYIPFDIGKKHYKK
ncbi:RER1-like protein [Gigaspora margarita]|uniref:Protein RER1 n=1 Tax=Gigaspora margarita TaxID=4874 RepID=A0A8H3X625_GIGMA|nr:RER1-like protein [Gigaspora margarita]